MSSSKVQLSIYDITSGSWGLACISLLPFMVHSIFHGLFLVRQAGETLESAVRKAFEWPVILELAFLIGATTCVVSATIHLFFLLRNRINLARRYSLIQNVSTLFTLTIFFIAIYVFLESFGSGSVGAG